MNNVYLGGRLTRDIELRRTQNGKTVASFTIAVNQKSGGADFFDCTAWETQAEILEKNAAKGSPIAIAGRLQTETFEKDGQKRKVVKVVVSEVYTGTKKDQFSSTSESDPFSQEGLPF